MRVQSPPGSKADCYSRRGDVSFLLDFTASLKVEPRVEPRFLVQKRETLGRRAATCLVAAILVVPFALRVNVGALGFLATLGAAVLLAAVFSKSRSSALGTAVSVCVAVVAAQLDSDTVVWPTRLAIGMAFGFGFLATDSLMPGLLMGCATTAIATLVGGGWGLAAIPAFVAGAVAGDAAPRLSHTLSMPFEAIPAHAAKYTAAFVCGFMATAFYFGMCYQWVHRNVPGAYDEPAGGLALGDYFALSLAILSAGEPTVLEPKRTVSRVLFATETFVGLLWVAVYLALLVAKFTERSDR
jgi:hypothetical protein